MCSKTINSLFVGEEEKLQEVLPVKLCPTVQLRLATCEDHQESILEVVKG